MLLLIKRVVNWGYLDPKLGYLDLIYLETAFESVSTIIVIKKVPKISLSKVTVNYGYLDVGLVYLDQ